MVKAERSHAWEGSGSVNSEVGWKRRNACIAALSVATLVIATGPASRLYSAVCRLPASVLLARV